MTYIYAMCSARTDDDLVGLAFGSFAACRKRVGGKEISMSRQVQIKRVYEPASSTDGTRVLVDRIWPRGLSKEAASLDLWMKEIAPSTGLRKWYGHKPERWPDFKKRYQEELAGHQTELRELSGLIRKGTVTLLYAAHDGEQSNAEVLRQYLARRSRSS